MKFPMIALLTVTAVQLLFPAVHGTLDYDTLRLRELINELEQRYPFLEEFTDDLASRSIPALGGQAEPAANDTVNIILHFVCLCESPDSSTLTIPDFSLPGKKFKDLLSPDPLKDKVQGCRNKGAMDHFRFQTDSGAHDPDKLLDESDIRESPRVTVIMGS